jgi:hypothetical protein
MHLHTCGRNRKDSGPREVGRQAGASKQQAPCMPKAPGQERERQAGSECVSQSCFQATSALQSKAFRHGTCCCIDSRFAQ